LALAAFGFMAIVHRSHALSPTHRAAAQKAAAMLTDSSDATAGAPAVGLEAKRAAQAAFARLPIAFTLNEGQLDERVSFTARGSGYQLFLTQGEAVLSLNKLPAQGEHRYDALPEGGELTTEDTAESRAVLRMSLQGANPKPRLSGEARLGGKANYFIGAEREKWRTDVSMFEKVRYHDVYPGIDLLYYGNQQQLEYDFVVAPYVDPARIKLQFEGAREIYTDADGNLVLRTEGGDVRQHKPIIYQLVGGERREVSGRYMVEPETVGFELGAYDRSEPLIIDPVLSYSSFLGGEGNDQALAVALDAEGNAYVTGQTESNTFPGSSPIQGSRGGVTDAYVLKVNAAGTALVYATYLGGNGSDTGGAIAVDGAGNAYVTGLTGSGSFPITAGAVQPSRSGSIDGFATKLNVAGNALAYSTYLGGNNADQGYGIGVDAAGNAYVTGRADSTTFLGGVPMPKRGSGAYKSTDAGSNWAAINNGLSEPNIETIVVDPTNSAILYAAGAQGVSESMDGGNLWRLTGQSRTSTAPLNVLSIAVDPTAPWKLYAGTVSGVYRSTSGGDLWDNSSIGLPSSGNFVRSIVIDPSNSSTLYAGTADGTYKSTDGAATWTRAANGFTSGTQVNRIVFSPTSPSTLYAATARGVYRSVDGAANWVAINNGLISSSSVPFSVAALVIDPLTPTTMYAAAQNSVYKTTDGGASWNPSGNGLIITPPGGGLSFLPSPTSLAINRLTPTTLYVGTSQGGIFKSTDGGANWTAVNNGLSNVTVRDITIDHSAPNTLYVATTSGSDAFVVKINQTGTGLGYLLYLGGDESDIARGIAVDASGNAYLTGTTSSLNFPTLNAAQPTYRGFSDAFVTKLAPDGTTLASTYLGGSISDLGFGIAVNASGNAYVTGSTSSVNFPNEGTRQTIYAGGVDIFVAKFNAALSSLEYSVTHGGSGSDQSAAIAVDAAGNAYVTGTTASSDFPVVDAVQQSREGGTDAFVLKLDAAGGVSYSTYLGGSNADQGMGIAAHHQGGAYVVGNTSSINFPTASPLRATYAGGGSDGFLARIATPEAQTGGVRFGAATYQFSEGAGRASITITRTSGSSVAASVSVEIMTVDDPASVPCDPAAKRLDGTSYPQGAAYARCDYATTIETVTFASGDAQPKTVNIPLIDDGYAEGNETVQLRLVNPVGATLGDPATATLTITDNDAAGAANPIFTSSFFVRMQYLDFLSREPEAGEPWTAVLNNCSDVNNNPLCDRITVSQSFFGSPEFRLKGFYVFIFYRVAFNRLPEYAEIIRDMRSVTGQTAAEVYTKRANFAAAFAARQEFLSLYSGLGDTAFVNALLDRYGLQQIRTADPQDPEGGAKVTLTRSDLIARLSATGTQGLTRAQVLRAIVESDEVGTAEYNRAFVAMQYYGYLRRTPEEDGYQAWLKVINEDPNNIRIMVNGFMNSAEYRLRFGQP
jgi:photosystem II stability/assembly factor-like uncharacterized protein